MVGDRKTADAGGVTPAPAALQLDTLEPAAPRAVRLEGAGFVVHDRVTVIAAGRGRVHAIVRGARPYDVAVESAGEGGLAATCDCVTFRERPVVCRHLWAALVTIQNDELLADPIARNDTPPAPIAAR